MRHLFTGLILLGAFAIPARAAHASEANGQAEQPFKVNPVGDMVLTVGGAGAALLTELILSTGEIVPQPITAGSESKILSFDRVAVNQTVGPQAGLRSNIGLGLAVGFAALDPILSGYRDGSRAGLIDAVMYGESLSLTLFLTDVTKIAVRRPRPVDYRNASAMTPNTNTDMVLSFFSGHASITAASTATATYLAFVRSPHTARPWITLAAGTLLTAFVSYERVRAGVHFPTDVIAGSLAGASVGLLVPLIHRHYQDERAFWIGLAPTSGGFAVSMHKTF